MSEDDVLHMRLQSQVSQPGVFSVQSIQVKRGPRAWKTAAVFTYGNEDTGEVTGTKLVVQTWTRITTSDRYDFQEKPQYRWYCEGSEVESVRELLNTELPHEGTFVIVQDQSPAALIARLGAEDTEQAVQAVCDLLSFPAVRDALATSGTAAAGAALVERKRKQEALDRLETAVLDADASEADLQHALDGQWWLFGGRFVDQHQRRSYDALNQLDIPLMRADGSLHIVELKKAEIPSLIREQRNHLIVGHEVNDAVGQTMNYLRAMDESSPLLTQNFGLDARRADATVVIGHEKYLTQSRTDAEIAQTFRTYNSHLSRVQVVTYDELIRGARAALKLDVASAAPDVEDDNGQPSDEWITPDPWD